jgi:hypothetical protein
VRALVGDEDLYIVLQTNVEVASTVHFFVYPVFCLSGQRDKENVQTAE